MTTLMRRRTTTNVAYEMSVGVDDEAGAAAAVVAYVASSFC